MKIKIKTILLLALVAPFLSACSTVTASHLTGEKQPAWDGPVFVSQTKLPAQIKYKIIGTVSAHARSGYSHVKSLYPKLASEARKMGANAIIDVHGGHQVVGFSWAAPYTEGTAVRVKNTKALRNLNGSFY